MSTERDQKINDMLTNITQEYIPHLRDKALNAKLNKDQVNMNITKLKDKWSYEVKAQIMQQSI